MGKLIPENASTRALKTGVVVAPYMHQKYVFVTLPNRFSCRLGEHETQPWNVSLEHRQCKNDEKTCTREQLAVESEVRFTMSLADLPTIVDLSSLQTRSKTR